MQFVREINDLEGIDDIRVYLGDITTPYTPSVVYDTATATSAVHLELRKSKYRSISDPALFDLVEKAVCEISDADPCNSFLLLRNDISHIVYDVGGYFTAHQDFLSLTSNCIQEYTLLICVSSPEEVARTPIEGGETKITIQAGEFELVSKA
jgi:hypothetical protein